MRLIDADKLEPHGIYNGVEYRDVVYLDDIKKMPTISKYKRILRCKNCKYWNPPEEYKGHVYLGTCARDEQAYLEDCAIQMDADDFCSKGEKR